MKRLHVTLYNSMQEEIFSDFIAHIDAVDSHTVIYHKTNYSEADVLRIHYDLRSVFIADGKVILYYQNGMSAELIRK